MHFRRHWRLGWKPTQAGVGWGLPSLAVSPSRRCPSFPLRFVQVLGPGARSSASSAISAADLQRASGALCSLARVSREAKSLVGGCGCASFRLCAWQCIRECVRVSEASGADSARASYVWHRHGHVREGRGGRPRVGGRCAALREQDCRRWARARVRGLVRYLWFAACAGVCALGWLDWRWHARRWARECAINWTSKQANLSRWVY
jgi:hypothetical protein